MNIKFKWNKALSIIVGMIVVVSIIGLTPTTLSYLTSRDNVLNPVELGKVDIEINEEFKEPDSWDGGTYKKVVSIQNFGTRESLIRVAIVPRWVEEDGVTPFAGDTSLLDINWSNVVMSSDPGDETWVAGGDGYYYYSNKIATGSLTTAIITSINFKDDVAADILQRYEGKKLIVDVQAEAVHAQKEAYEAVWSQMASSNSATDFMLEALIDFVETP